MKPKLIQYAQDSGVATSDAALGYLFRNVLTDDITSLEELQQYVQDESTRVNRTKDEKTGKRIDTRPSVQQYRKTINLLQDLTNLYASQEKYIEEIMEALVAKSKQANTVRDNIDKAITASKIRFRFGPIIILK